MTDTSESAEAHRKQKNKTIDLIEKSGVQNDLGKDELDEELDDSVHDVASDESFAEEKEEKVMPLFKAGSAETTREAVDERFAKEHEEIVTRDSILRKTLKMQTDKPSDETPTED
jgi:hypothetical protein